MGWKQVEGSNQLSIVEISDHWLLSALTERFNTEPDLRKDQSIGDLMTDDDTLVLATQMCLSTQPKPIRDAIGYQEGDIYSKGYLWRWEDDPVAPAEDNSTLPQNITVSSNILQSLAMNMLNIAEQLSYIGMELREVTERGQTTEEDATIEQQPGPGQGEMEGGADTTDGGTRRTNSPLLRVLQGKQGPDPTL